MTDEATKKYIAEKLRSLMPVFAKASIGDFSQEIEIPEEDDGFTELYAGIQVMLDVIKQKIAGLENEIQERRKQDERLRSVVDSMIEGFQIIGFDWKYHYVNQVVTLQGKKSREDLIGHTMMEIYPGIEDTEFFKQLKHCMENRVPHQMENKFVFPNGTEGWFQLVIEPISEGLFILSMDNTVKRRQEEELYRVASIVESSEDAIIGKDLEGKIISWNPGAEKLYGYTESEVIGSSITRIIPADKIPEFEHIMEQVKRGEKISQLETKRITKKGNILDVAVTISPIKNAEGAIIGASAIGRDITTQKREEEEVLRLAAIVESSEDAIIGLSREGVITNWNYAAEKLFGYNEQEVIGKQKNLLIPTDQIEEWNKFFEKHSFERDAKNFVTVCVRKDDRRIDVSITLSPIKDVNSVLQGISAIVRDITEQKKIDTMKNEFVALASHQLKTPLTSIKWYSELLLKNMNMQQLSQKQVDYLHEIHKANKRMIYLINALLNVSRIDLGTFIVSPTLEKVSEVLDSVIDEYMVQIQERRVMFEKHYANDIPRLLLDKNVMHIIFANLILNAIRYTAPEGKVSVSVTHDRKNVFIAIADNGIGIPASERDKLFKKFSRADNAMIQNTDGSGLGLYMVKSLVDQTGGTITYTSEENRGTTFIVSFPLSGMKEKAGTRQLQ